MARKRRVVLIQGAFDILNYGHVQAFRFAKAHGDHLIVALNTNELIPRYKNRQPVVPWRHKKAIIEACRYVDRVVPAPDFSPMKLLRRYDVDVYVISREWEHTKAAEIAYMRQKGGRVVIARRFAGVSTTEIKERLLKEHLDAGDRVHPPAGDQLGARPLRGAPAVPPERGSSAALPVRPWRARATGAGLLNGDRAPRRGDAGARRNGA
jgi:glycerol-3-phosphate cytidylyltransferase